MVLEVDYISFTPLKSEFSCDVSALLWSATFEGKMRSLSLLTLLERKTVKVNKKKFADEDRIATIGAWWWY